MNTVLTFYLDRTDVTRGSDARFQRIAALGKVAMFYGYRTDCTNALALIQKTI